MGATATVLAARRGRKYDQVLEGARQVFLAQGYEPASVDEIARAAGVSKATLYSYFPDKERLFIAVIQTECSRQAESALAQIDPTAPVRTVLTAVARHIVGFVLSDFAQSFFRLCIAEAERFPELGRAFYESGPQLGHDRLGDYLREACDAGFLRIEDIGLAADQFQELCKAGIWARAVFGVQTRFSPAELDRVIGGAVDTFLARYAART